MATVVAASTLAALSGANVLAGASAGSLLATPPGLDWLRETTASFPTSVADAAGDGTGLYVVGGTHALWPATTGLDAYVRRLDQFGNEVWMRRFGSPDTDHASSVAVHATGVYVVGGTEGTLPEQTRAGSWDALVRKYTANGDEGWTRQFGTAAYEQALATAVDDTGVVVAGVTNGALSGQTSAGGADAFVRKYDFDGTELWTRQFGTLVEDRPEGVVTDATGVYVLLSVEDPRLPGAKGVVLQKFDARGNVLWVQRFGTSASGEAVGMAADRRGVYIAIATEESLEVALSSQRTAESFLRRVDADGNERWMRALGPVNLALGLRIAADPTGIYTFRNAQAGCTSTVYLADKHDPDGLAVWGDRVVTYDLGFCDLKSIISTEETGLILVGASEGTLLVAKLSSAAEAAWFSAWSPRLPFVGAAAVSGLAFVVLRRWAKNAPDVAK